MVIPSKCTRHFGRFQMRLSLVYVDSFSNDTALLLYQVYLLRPLPYISFQSPTHCSVMFLIHGIPDGLNTVLV